MILKMLDYEKSKDGTFEKESWTYFDNITTARATYDEDIDMSVVSCTFKDNDIVTFAVKHIAYLMSDDGKTIDRIRPAERDVPADEKVFDTLQEAVQNALTNEC